MRYDAKAFLEGLFGMSEVICIVVCWCDSGGYMQQEIFDDVRAAKTAAQHLCKMGLKVDSWKL